MPAADKGASCAAAVPAPTKIHTSTQSNLDLMRLISTSNVQYIHDLPVYRLLHHDPRERTGRSRWKRARQGVGRLRQAGEIHNPRKGVIELQQCSLPSAQLQECDAVRVLHDAAECRRRRMK